MKTGGAALWPDARNEKAPARFLSGHTSAMIEACVKGGRFVNAVFVCISTPYTKAAANTSAPEDLFSES